MTLLESWILQESEENSANTKSKEKQVRKPIHIITMHGSKGLEFDSVFILDANQGIIPTSKAVRERDFAEERRLFYVAITMAKKYLNIYCVSENLAVMWNHQFYEGSNGIEYVYFLKIM